LYSYFVASIVLHVLIVCIATGWLVAASVLGLDRTSCYFKNARLCPDEVFIPYTLTLFMALTGVLVTASSLIYLIVFPVVVFGCVHDNNSSYPLLNFYSGGDETSSSGVVVVEQAACLLGASTII
jgi:hypothetical protein